MRTLRFALLSLPTAALLLMVTAPKTSAHEVRAVGDGQIQMVVGFLNEPAFSGEQNGLDLRVARVDPAATPSAEGGEVASTPVEGLETTLQAEVFYADQSMPLVITAAWDEPGAYESVFFPMQPGDYSFHIFGTIDGVAIDETFTSGPDTFGPMEDPAALQFPKETAANSAPVVTSATASGLGGFGGSELLVASGIAAVAGIYALSRRVSAKRSA